MKWLFLMYMMQFAGVPYRWGGNNPVTGMDCSGFVQTAFEPWGMDPRGDQTAAGLHEYFKDGMNGLGWTGKADKAPLGSLLFFGHGRASHIAISLGYGFMIEAGGGDSTTKTLGDAAFRGAYVRIRPISRRVDLMEIITPTTLPWL